MLIFKGDEFREFIKDSLDGITRRRDFSTQLESEYLLRNRTRRGVLVTGLRSTGKTIGVLQAIDNFDSDKIIFISATSRGEGVSKKEVFTLLKDFDSDLIFIDEYSWLISDDSEDMLADYLVGKAQEGTKVIISGTDSTKINELKNTDFIHRAIEINTTYFSYGEYCRIYDLPKNDKSMKDFLIKGGIFENSIYKSFGSMKSYIKDAIINNLSAYYPQFEKRLLEATIYKIFYDCICKNYIKNSHVVPVFAQGRDKLYYQDFLEDFGIDPSIEIPKNVLNEIFNKLKDIGVIVELEDIKISSHKRAYITNQSISAQLVKCIYELEELPETYLGDLYEASVVCYEYMELSHRDNSVYEMYFAETWKSDCEIDFILCDSRSAYLFDCKLSDNDNFRLNDTASLVSSKIENLLGDRDLKGRYVIYQGINKYIRINGKDVICTNNWDIAFEKFNEYLQRFEYKGVGKITGF